ncbi:ABC transporter ATP-binding protein [Ammoniphilus resinae]|uniref:ABC-2 type transport system ATP-binding protein n=1 Tax=Ammoniphilus resinae TaxID=861532 RepID=A0ABS4GN24_9BACL|nr:ABC transporter ATP-binding protein [Ammoniphilus resinae]MBP1931683.1 ABC-2 type transport system ATP-binding protein [Ammoniphilus resinae]
MLDPIIELQDLTKKYDQFIAVNRLSLSIQKGEVFGLLGPNGAGKSTTILMMLGLSEPTSGSVRVCGINSTREPILVKQKVGYLPDDVGFYEDLTGYENLIYTAELNRLSKEEAIRRAKELLARVGLSDAADKKAGAYSRGMRQRLGLADVLIKQPEVIILDEPTLGIDPAGVKELLQLIQRLSRDEGITVLLSSHHLHQVQQICDRVGIFVQGRLLAVGDVSALSRQLFAEDLFILEVGVKQLSPDLIEQLMQIDDVTSVKQNNELLFISCSRDLTGEIAETIVRSGARLTYLNQKQYGLDEIYHRYFERGEVK